MTKKETAEGERSSAVSCSPPNGKGEERGKDARAMVPRGEVCRACIQYECGWRGWLDDACVCRCHIEVDRMELEEQLRFERELPQPWQM